MNACLLALVCLSFYHPPLPSLPPPSVLFSSCFGFSVRPLDLQDAPTCIVFENAFIIKLKRLLYVFQQAAYSPVKSSRVVLPSPQKADIPATRPALSTLVSSPQKSSIQGTACASSPQKAEPSSSTSVPQSPLKNQALSRGFNPTSSPQKPELHAKPTIAGNCVPQEKASTGAPGESCCRKVYTG